MGTQSTNLNLFKPATSDFVDVTVDLSNNFDIIDVLMNAVAPASSAPGDVAATGSNSTHAARADHVHGRSDGYGGTPTTDYPTNSGSAGVSANVSRSDHKHGGSGITNATVATSQTTASTSYTDLATSGPAAAGVVIPPSGKVKVTITAKMANGTASDGAAMGFAVSGTDTTAAADASAIFVTNAAGVIGNTTITGIFIYTGTVSGNDTFTAKYRAITGGTATFLDRSIFVEPL